MATVVWASVRSADDLRRRSKSAAEGSSAVNYASQNYEEPPVREDSEGDGEYFDCRRVCVYAWYEGLARGGWGVWGRGGGGAGGKHIC